MRAGIRVAFRSELVKKWGLAPPPYAYGRENHANARCLSPFFHKLSAKERFFRGAKSDSSDRPVAGLEKLAVFRLAALDDEHVHDARVRILPSADGGQRWVFSSGNEGGVEGKLTALPRRT